MRKIQVNEGRIAPFEFAESAEKFCEDGFPENGKLIGEIKIVGEVVSKDEKLKVCGKIFCRRKFICDRCLSESEEDQVHDFEEELEKEEMIDGFVDVSEIVRDTLIISQPMRSLCSVDCKGLCPSCGKNLNEGDCDCDGFVADPRLAVLQDFKPN